MENVIEALGKIRVSSSKIGSAIEIERLQNENKSVVAIIFLNEKF